MKLMADLKAWWSVFVVGATEPPKGERKPIEELLKGYDDDEWEQGE